MLKSSKNDHCTLINPRIDELLEKVENKYVLASLVSKRVVQLNKKYLNEGKNRQVKELISEALEEVKEGKIYPKLSDEI
jgi:DNA-directed RNA polymerase omega subunit